MGGTNMSEELSNENLLIGGYYEILRYLKDLPDVDDWNIRDTIDSVLKSLNPPCDIETWNNDFPKGASHE